MRRLHYTTRAIISIVDIIGNIFLGNKNQKFSIDLDNYESILVIEIWGIGDFVISSYFLRNIRNHFLFAKITFICAYAAAELMKGCPFVDDVIPFQFPWTQNKSKYNLFKYNWSSIIKLIVKMRRVCFDVGITGRPDPRNNFLLWLFGVKTRVGFKNRGGGFFLTHPLNEDRDDLHATERWAAVLRSLNCDNQTIIHHFWLSKTEINQARTILKKAGVLSDDIIIGFHVCASSIDRKWPTENFVQVAREILRHQDVKVLIINNSNSTNQYKFHKLATMLPQVDLRILAAVINEFDILLCNDSGPMHIATAVGTRVIALFGKSNPLEFGPIGEQHTIIEADPLPCRPCYVKCIFKEPKCWSTITVSKVIEALEYQILKIKAIRYNG